MAPKKNIPVKKSKEEEILGEDLLGTVEVDEKYLGKCASFYYEYDECLRDVFGETRFCKRFFQSLKKCEESEGMFDDVLNALNITPKQKAYQHDTYS